MPDGEDSWYTDSQGTPAAKFESYIARDLIADVDSSYRTIGTRHGRAIAGLSMGGYGALKFGLKHANLFMFAGSFSGALAAGNASFTGGQNQKLAQELLTIYGPAGSQTRAENDLLAMLEKADPERLPFIYFDCGTDDRLLESNRAFAAALQKKKARYEYRETPGAHTWDYWDRQVPLMLDVLARKLAG
jgi:S-formylglutathione hydrolase FrmB